MANPDHLVKRVELGAPRALKADFSGLSRIGLRLANGLGDTLGGLGSDVAVSVGDVATVDFPDWKAALPETIAAAVFRAPRFKGGFLVSIPTALICATVDRLYGGDGLAPMDTLSFGGAEEGLFRRILKAVPDIVSASWADIVAITPSLSGEALTREALIFGQSADQVVLQNFECTDTSGIINTISFAYPLATLRTISALQLPDQEDGIEPDPIWRTRWTDAVKQARLPVRTVIARPSLPLSRLLSLAPGDIIPVCLPPHVPMTVAGRLFAHGTIGEANGRAALQIEKIENGVLLDD